MTPEQQEAKRRAEVMLAFANGAPIEWMLQNRTADEWQDAQFPMWDWHTYNYRVNPEPFVDWDAMPAWANAVAMRSNGDWAWFVNKPTGCVMDGTSGLFGFIPPEYAPKYAGTKPWHELIIERPKK